MCCAVRPPVSPTAWPAACRLVVPSYSHTSKQIAKHGDSLIARKCGPEIAAEARERAMSVIDAGSPGEASYEQALVDLDSWLRADGHRRNPGTTADLIAAGLFVLLREGRLHWQCW